MSTQKHNFVVHEYDFFFIIEQVVDASLKLQKNGLPWNKVVWDLQHAFVNETTKEVQLIYLPLDTVPVDNSIITFIENIIYSAKPFDEHDPDFVSRFVYFIKSLPGYPELSEGIEIIIDRCVEPAAENRYQSCADLLYDLEHPELITKGFKKKQRRKLISFIVAIGMSAVMAITGLALNFTATSVNNQDYDSNIAGSDPSKYYAAVSIYPARVDAYNMLIEYYKNHEATNDQITKIGNTIEANADSLDMTNPDIADMYYDMGKLYFSDYDGSFKSRAVSAQSFFKAAASADVSYDKKEIAVCYNSICEFMTKQSTTAEHYGLQHNY